MLYSMQSRERTCNQTYCTQWHDTSDISLEPYARSQRDAAFEKMLDPIESSSATSKSVARIMNLFVDDLKWNKWN